MQSMELASGTSPTVVNLRHWCVQSDAKYKLCESTYPTTAHIQLYCDYPSIHVFTDLQGFWASEAPQSTILSTLLITPYTPNMVVSEESRPSNRYSQPLFHDRNSRKCINGQYRYDFPLVCGRVFSLH